MKAPLGVVLFLQLLSGATACVTVAATAGQNGYYDAAYAPAGSTCFFPFTYNGISYSTCTNLDNDAMWCYTDSAGSAWGNCDASCPSITCCSTLTISGNATYKRSLARVLAVIQSSWHER